MPGGGQGTWRLTAEDVLNLEVGQAIARVGASNTAFNLRTFREPPARIKTRQGASLPWPGNGTPGLRREVEAELNRW